MRDFFWGWKRKAGVVALLLTCAIFVGWSRSGRFEDHLRMRNGDRGFSIVLDQRGLMAIGTRRRDGFWGRELGAGEWVHPKPSFDFFSPRDHWDGVTVSTRRSVAECLLSMVLQLDGVVGIPRPSIVSRFLIVPPVRIPKKLPLSFLIRLLPFN